MSPLYDAVAALDAGDTAVVVNRAVLKDGTPDVRLDLEPPDERTHSAYLTPDEAAALVAALLEAAALDGPAAPIATTRTPSQHVPAETALRRLTEALDVARAAGNGPGLILARVANGLTGQTNGPRERVIARRMYVAARPFFTLDEEKVKAIDAADIARARGGEA